MKEKDTMLSMQGRNFTPAAPATGALIALAVAGLLTACGGDGKSTQVAVKVNKDEVTLLELNEQLERIPARIPADQVESTRAKVIGSLVNQQLLVQQALERKLDRDPQIVLAMESARKHILAEAYVTKVIDPQAKPNDQEIRKYYDDNPALFSERKVYRLQELSIEANRDQEKDIESAAGAAKSLKQLADSLRERKIPFSADAGVRTAEQLPLAHLPQIAQLKSGNVLVFPSGNNRLSALEVVASESQPVDVKTATPVIEQFLLKHKREELAAAEIKRLRADAKIEYLGEMAKYAEGAAASDAAPGAAPGAAAAPAGQAKVADSKPVDADHAKGIDALH